mmetsp:Transcript_16715/g.25586  ORF Transcript_16715/g.25586 Transcript_16715/m.25586 type:complete len:193 (+) Transcript_16715:100-678(+)|eukprot:CAMPEP_0118701788 /NCGR_PEP_ID=MMETSP0800-20121206/17472_1 /TAXON_ID=210618 ORGANISM="Striatella unipunctata, Strain CCMP2910" /NCGR_SAMPLE_ID=MMETSP0800 /ASSEMBLY_ACC=CAM_ASM_000638 /LENGTH=192 /DNA_ID=CAMNT_0006602801 /DNA_START=86 /DNA_END=661 /DNA_ORIENTATION=-
MAEPNEDYFLMSADLYYNLIHSLLTSTQLEANLNSKSLSTMNPPQFILEPHKNDILLGRGGKNNQHVGNEQLRQLAKLHCETYRRASKKEKSCISRGVVKSVRSMDPPGRFLKQDHMTGYWDEVDDDVAREKAAQVLRDAMAISSQLRQLEIPSPPQIDDGPSVHYPYHQSPHVSPEKEEDEVLEVINIEMV